jgi:hypothetical protein
MSWIRSNLALVLTLLVIGIVFVGSQWKDGSISLPWPDRCHTFEAISHMTSSEQLSPCDEDNLRSLVKVIKADRDKHLQFIQIMGNTTCHYTELASRFETCAVPYLKALRAEAMLKKHTGQP